MAKQNDNGKLFDLQLQVKFAKADSGEKPPETVVYVYSGGGQLLQAVPVDGKGSAALSFPLPREAATGIRVLLGPRLEEGNQGLDELLRRGAQEQHLRIEAKDLKAAVEFQVLPNRWLCWLRSACIVQGTLLKRITSGGVNLDLPVCHARVEIYEVDPLWVLIPKLPDDILGRIRDIIIDPRPLPDPPPELFPGFVFPGPRPGPGPDPGPLATARAFSSHTMDAGAAAALKSVTASTELRFLAQSGSKLQFQQALIDNAVLVRPLLCYFYPRFVTMQKVGEAWTTECGHFQTLFFNGCHNTDVPDLYFKAYQKLFGFFDVEIYGPTPIACHTWWDYVCGTEVTLFTTSPFAITCAPCPPVIGPENWVLFMAMGNTSLKAIQGAGASGTTSGNWGLLEGGSPWGGTLRPRLDFDTTLRDSLGVKYYQLSWRPGTSGGWSPLNAEVYRHYTHVVGGELVIEPYKLGPNHMVVSGENLELYEIPPSVPPIGHWTIANAVTDTENGEFDTVTHAPGITAYNPDFTAAAGSDQSGLYQLRLELFDAAGIRIDIHPFHAVLHPQGKNIKYVVPDTTNLTGTIHTVNANTLAQPGGGTLAVDSSLILTLHIDNNHCVARTDPPVTPSGSADACCGVVSYSGGESVSLTYTAYHPHGFATHSLAVYRSATQILPSLTGGVGTFTLTRTVADMMTLARPAACLLKPVCTMAAFSENLKVFELATDGWGSYLGYNDEANRAFALAPA